MLSGIAGTALIFLTGAYALMILWFTVPLIRKRRNPSADHELPPVTIIIAARNEEPLLPACLDSILLQDYPAERYQVLVSDDHSTDRTAETVREYQRQFPAAGLILISAGPKEPAGKKAAIERALAMAAGEVILTTDADTSRGTGWLRAMTAGFPAGMPAMVLGPVLLTGSCFFQRLQRLEFLGIMGLTAGSAVSGTPLMCNGANLLYSKSGFFETGGFGGNRKFSSGDDQFLLAGFRKRYGRNAVTFAFRDEAVVSTPAENTFAGFLNQRFRWVSKSRGYRDPVVILVGAITWIFQAALLVALVAGMFGHPIGKIALLCVGIKLVADLPLVAGMAIFFRTVADLWLYLPAQLFQVVYVPLTGLLGLILPYRWKGRLIRA